MSQKGLKAAGKAMLVFAGLAFGFHKGVSGGRTGVETPAGSGDSNGPLPEVPAGPRRESGAGGNGDGYVTREELEKALEQANRRLETELDRRFEIQNHSIGTLFALVSQTDKLLEQVLLHLEDAAAGVPEDVAVWAPEDVAVWAPEDDASGSDLDLPLVSPRS